MNSKLRQFEKESKLEIFGLGARREIWEAALEKYAELVVNECCKQLSEETIRHDGYGYNQHFLYEKLRNHFGVKE